MIEKFIVAVIVKVALEIWNRYQADANFRGRVDQAIQDVKAAKTQEEKLNAAKLVQDIMSA